MSHNILKLSPELANQIAAGEVVERPLSVVKELVENALDAGATSIAVRIKDGGKTSIEVQDNGGGIQKEDLRLALEKYATSKIHSLQELYEVMSFGFRGEALASIASVSDFSLASKYSDAPHGYAITGENTSPELHPLDVGTQVRVENLFSRTPARLGYLKTERTEFLKIKDWVEKMSLVFPHVHFLLDHDGKNILNLTPESLKNRMYHTLGEEFSQQSLEMDQTFAGLHITGYISDPKIFFQNSSRQILSVNGRIISSPIVQKAIKDAYNRFIPHGSYPGYVLDLKIDPTQVDVNVHPRKLEVRFATEQQIFRSVFHAIKERLEAVSLAPSGKSAILESKSGDTDMMPSFSGVEKNTSSSGVKYYQPSGTQFRPHSPYTKKQLNPSQATIEFSSAIFGNTSDISQKSEMRVVADDPRYTPLGRIIGQAHKAYIIVESEDGIVIYDQHALAERVNYEKLVKQAGVSQSQRLLGALSIKISNTEGEILENYAHVFEQMGFEFEMLPGSVILQSIPDFLARENIEKIFLQILSDVSEQGSRSLDEVRNKIWAYTACRSAVKFGDTLSILEMNHLLQDASLEYSATCPHGRPVVYDISLEDLLGKYER